MPKNKVEIGRKAANTNAMTFDRTGLDEVMFYNPKTGKSVTKREAYQSGDQFHRNDIGMVNLYDGDGNLFDQAIVYPTSTGEPEGDGLAYMSTAMIEECRRLNRRMCELAAEFDFYKSAMRL